MRIFRLVPLTVVLALAAGCAGGPKPVIVKGKLTDGGKPVLASKQDGLTMVFVPVSGDTTFPAGFNSEDNTFQVHGPALKGIPPGKYKVTLNVMSMKPSPAYDKLNQQYGADSPIEIDVTDGGPLEIDIAKFKKK